MAPVAAGIARSRFGWLWSWRLECSVRLRQSVPRTRSVGRVDRSPEPPASTAWSAFQGDAGLASLDDRAEQGETSLLDPLVRRGTHRRAIIETISPDDQAHDQSGTGEYPQQQARPRLAKACNLPALAVVSYFGRASDAFGDSFAPATDADSVLPLRGRLRWSVLWESQRRVVATPRWQVTCEARLHTDRQCLCAPLACTSYLHRGDPFGFIEPSPDRKRDDSCVRRPSRMITSRAPRTSQRTFAPTRAKVMSKPPGPPRPLKKALYFR